MQIQIFKLLVLVLILFTSNTFAEQQRHIHINGEHLNEQMISKLDALVGSEVSDGYYWLNLQTGQWGYEGNPQVQGVVAQITAANQPQASQQVSEYRRSELQDVSSTGRVTSGRLNGQNCTFVSVGGTTLKSCD